MKNTSLLASVILGAFTLATQPADAQLKLGNGNNSGIMQCNGRGDNAASAGKMSTNFANKFWSHLGCGDWETGKKILEAAPKAPANTWSPTVGQFDKGESLAVCYYKSFPYETSYHRRTLGENGQNVVNHGFYGFNEERFRMVERAVLAACLSKGMS